MNNLESLFSLLSAITIEDIAQAPHEEQPQLVDNIEDLQDRLKAILSAIRIKDITQAPHEEQTQLVVNSDDLQDRLKAMFSATGQPLPAPPTIH